MDARLLDGNRPQSGGKGPLGQMAVADDLAKAVAVAAVPSAVDPVGDLGLNGLGESLLDAAARTSVRTS